MKRIVSMWLPAWPIERRRRANKNSVPRDEPFALVVSGQRGVRITAVNNVAAQQGVTLGMGLADVRAAVPNLRSAPAELERDRAALNALARWCGRYGPNRHRDGCDGIWIDVTGVAHLFGGERGLLTDLCHALRRFGISASVGLADTLGGAHALARYGHVRGKQTRTQAYGAHERAPQSPIFIAPPEKTAQHLAALPVNALRLSPDTALLLERLGLTKIGQLYDLPRATLERRFRSKAEAEAVLLRLDQALGRQAEPRRPLAELPALRVQRSWPDPLISTEGVEAEVQVLAQELGARLEDAGLGCHRVRLALYRSDGSVGDVSVGMSRATRDPDHILTLLREKFGNIDAGFGVDVMALEAFQTEPLVESQASLQAGEGSQLQDPAQLIDRLANRLGPKRVYQLSARESHVPERAQIMAPATAVARGKKELLSSPSGEIVPWAEARYRQPPRPLFLLAPPEPITVMAEIPEGAPKRFTWRRVVHRVVHAEGPERIAPEWWRDLPTPTLSQDGPDGLSADMSLGEPVAQVKRARVRDYYRLEVSSGAVYWVFRDGLYATSCERDDASEDVAAPLPCWFVHGLFG